MRPPSGGRSFVVPRFSRALTGAPDVGDLRIADGTRFLGSEIRLGRDRDVIIEKIEVALGADDFDVLPLDAPVTPHSPPRLMERVWVVHAEARFHHSAVVD